LPIDVDEFNLPLPLINHEYRKPEVVKEIQKALKKLASGTTRSITIKSKEIEKKTTANMKHKELVQANKKVVEVICSKLVHDGLIDECTEVCKEHMNLCSMKILSELTNPQLEAFILAHDTSVTKSQLPTKEKLNDAEDNTVRNRTRLAFNCRKMPNKIEGMLPFDLSHQADEDEAENFSFHKITLTKDSKIPLSTLLSDQVWVKYVIRLLDLETTANATTEIFTTDKEKADLLLIKIVCDSRFT